MPAPVTTAEFLDLARRSGLLEDRDLNAYLRKRGDELPGDPKDLATEMVRDGLLTSFQAGQFLKGKHRGFIIAGKYRLLEHLGTGGMGSVFLCEHASMRRRVALKVLPASQAKDPGAVERFYREARAVAHLDHPNLVRAHDIDKEHGLHFLVMEYVEGSSLQDIVRKKGPLEVERAAHYIRQATAGLDHAHAAGIVHRDIKPGNVLVDRTGTVKILDMGLARFFHDERDDLTKKFDENCVLGTADYCAPEQALNSHGADGRADIYSLGATFYFLLTGKAPFGEGTTAQKIVWHQMKEPPSVREMRPEMPEGLEAVLVKMMAKNPEDRYQTPAEVHEALAPWTENPVAPPTEDEMPRLCPRSKGPGSTDPSTIRRQIAPTTVSVAPTAPTPKPTPLPSPDTAPTVVAKSKRVEKVKPLVKRPPPILLIAGAAGAVVLLLALVGGVAAWAFFGRKPEPVVQGPTARNVPPVEGSTNRASEKGPEITPPPVTITKVDGKRLVKTANYEATVTDDGYLESLRVGGNEFFVPSFKFGNNMARGAYLYSERDHSVQRLPVVEQTADNVITARGGKAKIQITCTPTGMTWTLDNLTADEELRLYILFDKKVTAKTNGTEWQASPPREQEHLAWSDTSWFSGTAKLTFHGGTALWGPFPNAEEGGFQVWQASVPPGAKREVTLEVGKATKDEQDRAAEVARRAEIESPSSAGVTVKDEKGNRRVVATKYEALVEKDGCMTSLKIAGVEMFRPGISFSRGLYFHQEEVGTFIPMPQVDQPGDNVITARGERSSIRYEFGADSMVWSASNDTDKPMNLFIVFALAVKSVTGPDGETVATPASKPWRTTTWHAGAANLKIQGGTQIWGPWPSKNESQVWHVLLAPREKRKIVLQVVERGSTTGLNLLSPKDYQVFQRKSRKEGEIVVRGAIPAGCDAVEARVTGQSLAGALPERWQAVALTPDRKSFEAKLTTQAGGWYRLELRSRSGTKVADPIVVEHVGVGEVFVVAGQSNSTNCGEEKLSPASGRVATFDGYSWRPADDPQPGVHDGSSGGSPWPAFGDAIAEKYQVPVGIASTGHGGTTVAEWAPDNDLFKWLTGRMEQLGARGFRCVLWHQGESDYSTSAADYAKRLTDTIEATRKFTVWEVPWMVALVSYSSAGSPTSEATRSGQKKLWETKVALEGPDTDTLTGDNRDQSGQGVHFSAKGLRAHGKLWADKVSQYLDTVLKD
jgi:serine/threonine protein kinase